ncbi:helix-turn-helix domain-containing protein [Cryobacterium sp. Y62]|uniref:helix-turn-helix domain-containing protein n=1 Tax=Cryobacterium sp. Y62 TaxID=2048284 RepID=UPI002100AAF7|nr:helix-turn-helix domain-containing protein [Cryobacterium sp. Y62]
MARVASTLVKLAAAAPPPRFGHAAVVTLTPEQLAGRLGATREATSKTMAELAVRNLIRQGRGRIIIQDTAALQTIARRTT